jgi:hypothetical protein
MSRQTSESVVRQAISQCCDIYRQEGQRIQESIRAAEAVLDMTIEVMEAHRHEFERHNVPAKTDRAIRMVSLEIGSEMCISGKIAVTRTNDGRIQVIRERFHVGKGRTIDKGPLRLPSDFGRPHWHGELKEAFEWIFDSAELNDESDEWAPVEHDE